MGRSAGAQQQRSEPNLAAGPRSAEERQKYNAEKHWQQQQLQKAAALRNEKAVAKHLARKTAQDQKAAAQTAQPLPEPPARKAAGAIPRVASLGPGGAKPKAKREWTTVAVASEASPGAVRVAVAPPPQAAAVVPPLAGMDAVVPAELLAAGALTERSAAALRGHLLSAQQTITTLRQRLHDHETRPIAAVEEVEDGDGTAAAATSALEARLQQALAEIADLQVELQSVRCENELLRSGCDVKPTLRSTSPAAPSPSSPSPMVGAAGTPVRPWEGDISSIRAAEQDLELSGECDSAEGEFDDEEE